MRKSLLVLLAAALATVAVGVAAEPARIGWQVPWATQGQLVTVLRHTNILDLVGLDATFQGFLYGAPLNQAALAGQVDVLLTADQPAVTLISRAPGFAIVGRLMYNRVCLMVPPNSPVHSLADLKGKRVNGPVGAAAEHVALAAMADAGIDLSQLTLGNLNVGEQAAVIRSAKDPSSWGAVDALYAFDPLPAEAELAGRARMLHCGQVLAVILANESLRSRPQELSAFLRAVILGWSWYGRNRALVDALYIGDAGMQTSARALEIAAAVEPNARATDPAAVSLSLGKQDLAALAETQAFLRRRGQIPTVRDPADMVDERFPRDAMADTGLQSLLDRVSLSDKAPR